MCVAETCVWFPSSHCISSSSLVFCSFRVFCYWKNIFQTHMWQSHEKEQPGNVGRKISWHPIDSMRPTLLLLQPPGEPPPGYSPADGRDDRISHHSNRASSSRSSREGRSGHYYPHDDETVPKSVEAATPDRLVCCLNWSTDFLYVGRDCVWCRV